MAIDIDRLYERIQEVDIRGMVSVNRNAIGEEQQPVVEVHFLTLKGACKKDQTQTIPLTVGVADPKERPNDLLFIVKGVYKCEPYDKTMTLYMDANGASTFGAYKWDPESNRITLTYCLPVPESIPGHPDTALLRRILSGLYEKLLFSEFKPMKWSIYDDDMLNDEEKKAKAERLDVFAGGLLESSGTGEDEGI